MRFRQRISELVVEWRARRHGRRSLSNDIYRSARDIAGPTGYGLSETWRHVEHRGQAYVQSFDRRLPPSLHISERDAVRAGKAIPLAERCIEDYQQAASDDEDPDRWSLEEFNRLERERRRND